MDTSLLQAQASCNMADYLSMMVVVGMLVLALVLDNIVVLLAAEVSSSRPPDHSHFLLLHTYREEAGDRKELGREEPV